jgi:hypothetical protein
MWASVLKRGGVERLVDQGVGVFVLRARDRADLPVSKPLNASTVWA